MTKGKKAMIIIGSIVLILVIICLAVAVGFNGKFYDKSGKYNHVSGINSYDHCINHPAFAEFNDDTSPFDTDTFMYKFVKPLRMSYVCMFLEYQSKPIIDGINFIIDAQNDGTLTVFDLYTENEIALDSSKNASKLLFVPSENAGAPFALVCAGGALNTVALIQEGYPIAQKLHQEGYNVFMLKYRVGAHDGEEDQALGNAKLERAMEDVARAYEIIFTNRATYGYSTDNYSMWGFSAGGALTANWSLLSEYGYMNTGIPAPAMISLSYMSVDPNSVVIDENTPATYVNMGEKDQFFATGIIADKELIAKLSANGIATAYDYFEGKNAVGHGFGRGDGTPAEGWMDKAIALWETVQQSS